MADFNDHPNPDLHDEMQEQLREYLALATSSPKQGREAQGMMTALCECENYCRTIYIQRDTIRRIHEKRGRVFHQDCALAKTASHLGDGWRSTVDWR